MRLHRAFATSHFRLALAGMAVFGVLSVLLLVSVYVGAVALIDHDIDETIEAEARVLVRHYNSSGLIGLRRLVDERADEAVLGIYALADSEGASFEGNLAAWPEGPREERWVEFDRVVAGARHQARAKIVPLGKRTQLLVGQDISERQEFKRLITQSVLWGLAATLVLSLLGGVFLSRRLLKRVDGIARATQRIVDGDLRQRLPMGGSDDEFDRLCRNVNDMLDQIEKLTLGMRATVDSLSHDLRGPLTRLRGRMELTVMREPNIEAYRAALKFALAETDRVLATFNTLLQIAQAEAGVASRTLLDLGALAADVAELYEPAAEERRLRLEVTAEHTPVLGNRELLAQALANLLDNAIKYSPPESAVRIEVSATAGEVVVSIADNGPGIPEDDRARVLQRFVRLDSSRSTPGSGLGLSLVAAVVSLHQGRIRLDDNGPGLKVSLGFPASAEP